MRRYMTDRQYQAKMLQVKRNNVSKQRKLSIKKEKEKYGSKIETSKLLAIYLLGLMNLIIVYALVAMWHFGDLSYLGVLVTDIAAQILTYAIYCVKAFKGKQAEEEMNFRREQFEQQEEELYQDTTEEQ